jgi:hypothetical protein
MVARPSSIIGLLVGLLLIPAFAAADALPEPIDSSMPTDFLDMIDVGEPMSPPPPPPMDGRGGGGDSGGMGMVFPGPAGGIQVDATVSRNVSPDFIALNVYCDVGRRGSREQARDALQQLFTDIRNAVGTDGIVRRSGGMGIYPFFDPRGEETGAFSGSMNIFIRVTNPKAAERIFNHTEDKNCTPNWDVRLVDTLKHETAVLPELTKRLHDRKEIFEKLLNRRLTRILSASLYTWVDGYATYDPSRNTAEATTTLSVSFDPGARALLRTPAQ